MPGHIRLFSLCFLACLGCAHDAAANPRGGSASYVVRVQDESGRELPTFHHAGQSYVLGRFGERYDIRVENRTGRRVEAVVTVDGRDVMTGEVGDFVHARGYLIEAYDELVIAGFRQSFDAVAAFRFTSPRASYSARMGTPENVGVIGVAVFPERERPKVIARPRPAPEPRWDDGYRHGSAENAVGPAQDRGESAPAERERSASGSLGYAPASQPAYDEYKRRDARAERSSAASAPSKDNLGTEYGESLTSSVQEVAFERADRSHPAALMTLRYDDREGLLARGIALERPPVRRPCAPDPFPSNHRFAPPPPACGD
jgi:hypothetical protein